jgi:uncharacterized Zn-finger protein
MNGYNDNPEEIIKSLLRKTSKIYFYIETKSISNKCTYENCNKVFSTKGNLKAHELLHQERNFTCNFEGCGKSYVNERRLEVHSRTHVK